MGVGDHHTQVYLIDFGLSRMYRDPKTYLHIPYRTNCHPTGTIPYISIEAHRGVQQSRRDDIESLAYVLLYFLHGSLPWHDVKPIKSNRQHWRMLQQKLSSPLDLLLSKCPNEFKVFLSYARALRFDEKPDYSYLRKLFRNLLLREGYQYDRPFPRSIMSNIPDDQITGARAKTNKRKVLQEMDIQCNSDRM